MSHIATELPDASRTVYRTHGASSDSTEARHAPAERSPARERGDALGGCAMDFKLPSRRRRQFRPERGVLASRFAPNQTNPADSNLPSALPN